MPNTVSISADDLHDLIKAASSHRRVLREASRAAQAEGDIRKRNLLGEEYHQLSRTLRIAADLYVESL